MGRAHWSLGVRMALMYSALIFAVAGALTIALYFELRDAQRQATRERLQDILSFSMPLVDGEFHSLIRQAGDENSSFYQNVFETLQSIKSSSLAIRRIYTVRRLMDGSMVYVVDTAAKPNAIGSVYEPPAMLKTKRLEALFYPAVEQGLYFDSSGAYQRGFAPIYDEVRRLDGLLVIEIDANPVLVKERQASQTVLIIFLVAVPISMLLGWLLAHRFTSPLSELVRGAQRVAQGELDHLVEIGRRDEVGEVADAFNAMTVQLRQTVDALRSSEAKFRSLIENGTDIILLLNASLEITYISPSLHRWMGYTAQEAMQASWMDAIHPMDLPVAQAGLARVLQRRASINGGIKIRLRHKNGSWRTLECVGSNLLNDPAVNGIVVNSRDITDREQREHELQSIVTVVDALRAVQARAEMMPVILEELFRMMPLDGAALILRDAVSGELVCERGAGVWVSWTGVRVPANAGISGQVILAGRPYVNNQVDNSPVLTRAEMVGDARAVVCVPLTTQGRTVGVLWVGRSPSTNARLSVEFSDSELRLLLTVANIAANSIHRATLYEQAERQLQRLSALHAIDELISTSTDVHLALDEVLNQAMGQLKVDAAAILRYKAHSQTLDFAEGRGFRGSLVTRVSLPLASSLPGRAARENRTLSASVEPDCRDYLRSPYLMDERFVDYYCVPLTAKGQIKGVLEIYHRSPLNPDPEWLDFLDTLGGQAAIAIDNAELLSDLQRSNRELALAYDTTLEGWSHALDLRDNETEGHTRRVAELTLRLARSMNIPEGDLIHIWRGALLHDIGKMAIPDEVLRKPGPLTADDQLIMRKHPEYAFELLSPIPYLRPAIDIPYLHHERWDGKGYPHGLKGEQIPLAVRIFAIVDVWDALSSDRPYRKAWSRERALDYIREQSGKHFDPAVAEAFFKVV